MIRWLTHASFEQRFAGDDLLVDEVASVLGKLLKRDQPRELQVDGECVSLKGPMGVFWVRLKSIRGLRSADFEIRRDGGTLCVRTSLAMNLPLAAFAMGVILAILADLIQTQQGRSAGMIVAARTILVAGPFVFALWARFLLKSIVRSIVREAVARAKRDEQGARPG